MPAVENSLIPDRFVNEFSLILGEKRQRRLGEITSGLKFRGRAKVSPFEKFRRKERIKPLLNRNFFSLSKRRDFEIGTRRGE